MVLLWGFIDTITKNFSRVDRDRPILYNVAYAPVPVVSGNDSYKVVRKGTWFDSKQE